MRNAAWQITEKYVSLPGGVTLTLRPAQSTTAAKSVYTMSNIHGDAFLTVDGTGTLTRSMQYDPFGVLLSANAPDNLAGTGEFSWLGGKQKMSETDMTLSPVQMGVRVYIPTMGRFLRVDPIEGGTPNNYVYATDPVNQYDINGMWVAYIWAPTIINSVIAADKTSHFKDGGSGYVKTNAVTITSTSRTAAAAQRKSISITIIKQVMPISPPRNTAPFNYFNASSSAISWYYGGSLTGGIIGCALGGAVTWYAGGAGCIPAAEGLSTAGGWLGAAVGFYLGGHRSDHADDFEWGPDQVVIPWR